MDDDTNIQKIDLDKVDWRGSREFFESLGEALDKLEDKDETYDFTWVGKRKSIIEAGAPINKTFRPDVDASKNWDVTENLFIEGDNLDALKLLQESYLGKVKMIYIDPPYNTGKDFVYHDDFKRNSADWDEETAYRDDEGNILEAKRNPLRPNLKANGRYHSDWLSMIYPRLKLARNLLRDDGVIFISIDENEASNLKKLCDEIFGEENFISQAAWQKVYSPKNQARYLSNDYEFVLIYARSLTNYQIGLLPRTEEMNARYSNPDNDHRGDWKSGDLVASGVRSDGDYIVVNPHSGKEYSVPSGKHWAVSRSTMQEMLKDNRIFFGKYNDSFPSSKQFLSEVKQGRVASSLFSYKDYGHTDEAKKDFIKLFGEEGRTIFETLKPVRLVKMLALIAGTKDDDVVLDFFCGSGTTAQSLMQLNADDGGNRKWIMVQLPEETDETSEAYKAGYKTIPEISRERIRRAGDKIASEKPDSKVDYGFRSLTIVDTNYKDVYKSVSETTQLALSDTVDNIKEDRSELDLLYGVLTATALELNRPFEKRDIVGSTVYLYDYFSEVSGLIACFSESVSEETIKAIASLKPLTAVFKDSSFPDSQAKVNLSEHFRIISPETKVKVI